jgi:hypothetical protein
MRRVFGWSLLSIACSDETASNGTTTSSGAEESTSSGANPSASSTSEPTTEGSSSADTSGSSSSDGTTGEALPCGCAPGEVCIELSSDACLDPHLPITYCSQAALACEGVAFTCDSACGWDTCGGPGCLGVGAEVCGVPSQGIVCHVPQLLCNLFAQGCSRGEKCNSWDSDGDQAYDATRCSPAAEAAVPVGGACTFEGTRWNGIDDCVVGAMCLTENPGDPTGICRAACVGNPYGASCEDPTMTCVLEGEWFGWCLPT